MDFTAVNAAVASIRDVLSDRELWQPGDEELSAAFENLHRLQRVLGFHTAEVLGELDLRGVPLAAGFRATEGWLASTVRVDLGTARRDVAVARAMRAGKLPTVTQAWGEGHFDGVRAGVVQQTVRKLRVADVAEDDVVRTEEVLASHAWTLSPSELEKTARAVRERLAPKVDERHDDPATREFTVSSSGWGSDRFAVLNGAMDQAGAETLLTAVSAFMPPRSGFPECTEAQLRGQALVDMADAALTVVRRREVGGPVRAVAVTVPLAALQGEPGTARSAWTGPGSVAAARQAACDAEIIPVVLGGDGQPLDVGRGQRLVTAPIRVALVERDGGCVWPGCHRPSPQTEAHHVVHWANGGATSLENLALFCSFHHHRFHAGEGWSTGLVDGLPFVQAPVGQDPRRTRRFHERFLARRVGFGLAV